MPFRNQPTSLLKAKFREKITTPAVIGTYVQGLASSFLSRSKPTDYIRIILKTSPSERVYPVLGDIHAEEGSNKG